MRIKYLELINRNYPRLLSSANRNQFSNSFGCLDREFWHYRLGRDFPSSIFQNGSLPLTLLYKNNFPGNTLFKEDYVLDLVNASIQFWASIQNRDGSFSEWFPNERSHVATAFTAYAVSESLLVAGEDRHEDRAIEALKKAGDWLAANPEDQVSNHLAGAVLALFNIFLLTREGIYKEASLSNLELLLSNQSSEGWFPEYGGADLGYLSLTVDYLAKFWSKTRDDRVLLALERAVDFMSYFVHPDGSYGGGVWFSRNKVLNASRT